MIDIVGVQFERGGKTYYFNPKGIEYRIGDGVIVETANGVDYAVVCLKNKNIEEKEIAGELKAIVRAANDSDMERVRENVLMNANAMRLFREKIGAHGIKMKAVNATYTFDRNRLTCYFIADGRIDFRELVRDLAGELHTRIELRQIHERDDIKIHGAVAACGRPCCCTVYPVDSDKVSVKMAKNQGISLASSKISGTCGKLMCCLKYENDFYSEVLRRMPKVKSRVSTKDGIGTVDAQNLLNETVRVRIENKDGGIDVREYRLDEIKSEK